MPVKWSEYIMLDPACSEADRRAFTTVLNDMARSPEGRHILEDIKDKKLLLTSNVSYSQTHAYTDWQIAALREGGNLAPEITQILDCAASQQATDAVAINFDELRSTFKIDEKTGELAPVTLNSALAHELAHIGTQHRIDALVRRSNALLSQKLAHPYRLELQKALKAAVGTGRASQALEAQLQTQFPEMYQSYQTLQQQQRDIAAQLQVFDTYDDEQQADALANAYTYKEIPRRTYRLIDGTSEPVLPSVVYYENGNYDAKAASEMMKRYRGSRYLDPAMLSLLVQESHEEGDMPAEKKFARDLRRVSENLQQHTITYADLDSLNMNELERQVLHNAATTQRQR